MIYKLDMDDELMLEIRAGEGGDDAKLLVADFGQAYVKLASHFGGKAVAEPQGSGSQILCVTFARLQSFHSLTLLENEAGGHRVQRIPPAERRGRVHSSTITVAVLPVKKDFDANLDPSKLGVVWHSGTGKGGQHRNRHCNSILLDDPETGIRKSAQTRSRANSFQSAFEALQDDVRTSKEREHSQQQNRIRQAQIGSGERSDKRRTYRFQDDVVIDHVTGRSARAGLVMKGRFDSLWSIGSTKIYDSANKIISRVVSSNILAFSGEFGRNC